MALTGFDPSLVKGAVNAINQASQDIEKALFDTNYNSFVSPMSAIWGSPQAVKFFGEYRKAVLEINKEVSKTLTSVFDSMNSAASNLAAIAGSSWARLTPWRSIKDLDVSCVKDNINGVIGIDTQQATNLSSQMQTIVTAIGQALQEAVTAVDNSGFIGGEMQSSLKSSLTKIRTNIAHTFNELRSQVSTAINETATQYGTTSTNISSAFGGGAG